MHMETIYMLRAIWKFAQFADRAEQTWECAANVGFPDYSKFNLRMWEV